MAGWLSLCAPAFAEAVLTRGRVVVVEAGEPLFHPGDPPTGIFGVLSGAVSVSIALPELGPSLAHIFQPGSWFGESAFARHPRIIGVHATRPTRVVFLALRDVEAMVMREPRHWLSFAQLAILNGELALGAACDLMLRDPLQRCAATLLRLGGRRHGPVLTAGPVAIDVTQSSFAQMTNLSRNSVGAILRILRERNCVDVDYGQLRITDPDGLSALLSADPGA